MNSRSSKCFYMMIVLISMSLLFFSFYSSITYALDKSGSGEVKDVEESKSVYEFLRKVIGEPNDESDSGEIQDVEESKPVYEFLHEVVGEPNTLEGSSWYAGTWDSTLYLNARHPKTIAIRMKLLDKDTVLPISEVNVSLKGEYPEARIGQSISDVYNYSDQDVLVDPEEQESQGREFRLDAVSDSMGIVVFSLNWQKEYPWAKVDDERQIYFDNIEKVQRLEMRHPDYEYIKVPVDFKHIVDMELYEDTSQHNNSKVRKFEALWQNEVKRRSVKLFVLNLNENFPDFNNKFSKRGEFFEKVRDKDYGMVISDVNDLPDTEAKAKCGPYFVYDMGNILLERSKEQMEDNEYKSNSKSDVEVSNEPLYSQQSISSDKVAETDQSMDTEIDTDEHFDIQNLLDKTPESMDTSMDEDVTVGPKRPVADDVEPAAGDVEPTAGGIESAASQIGREEKSVDFDDGVTLEFVLIPAGEFDMGSPETEKDRAADEGPVHKVKISKSFYMSKYEVTQDLYSTVMGSNPSMFKKGNRPVERVTWQEAAAFCERLSETYDGSYRLPTEAEWEFACRAGTQTRFYFGDDPGYSQLERYAWCSKNSGATTQPVGSKNPNSFGLYDMHGNVWEWCSDWYAEDYYNRSPDVDPQGPHSGVKRVFRGGGWLLSARCSRSAVRGAGLPNGRSNRGGFRVVLDMD